jgi:hypothetical protein
MGFSTNSITTSGGGTQNFEFVGETDLSAGASQTLDSSTLDLNTDELYFVKILIKQITNTGTISIYMNDDTTAANYYSAYHKAYHSTLTGSKQNSAILDTGHSANEIAEYTGFLYRNADGLVTLDLKGGKGSGNSMGITTNRIEWQTTSTNVTGIKIISSAVNLGTDTKLSVWKITQS